MEQTRKTLLGLNRSATENSANRKVPIIKPSITAEVTFAKLLSGKSHETCT